MKKSLSSKIRKEINLLRSETQRILEIDPKLEYSHVYHTLLLLSKTPAERLKMALLRAKKISIYK